jgi:hypothetical protein
MPLSDAQPLGAWQRPAGAVRCPVQVVGRLAVKRRVARKRRGVEQQRQCCNEQRKGNPNQFYVHRPTVCSQAMGEQQSCVSLRNLRSNGELAVSEQSGARKLAVDLTQHVPPPVDQRHASGEHSAAEPVNTLLPHRLHARPVHHRILAVALWIRLVPGLGIHNRSSGPSCKARVGRDEAEGNIVAEQLIDHRPKSTGSVLQSRSYSR